MERDPRPDVTRGLEDLCDPRRMALLVFDMKVGLTDGLPRGRTCLLLHAQNTGRRAISPS